MLRSGLVGGLLLSLSMCALPKPGEGEGESESEESGDGDGDGDVECPAGCEENDAFEPNDTPDSATPLIWDDISSWHGGTLWDANLAINAFLCPGEHDWYLIPVDELGFEDYVLHLDGLVMGTSWCPYEECDSPALPEAFENTLAIEVYNAHTHALLANRVEMDGRVVIKGFTSEFGTDLLVHVHGLTPAATYAYELYVRMQSYDGEDECEC